MALKLDVEGIIDKHKNGGKKEKGNEFYFDCLNKKYDRTQNFKLKEKKEEVKEDDSDIIDGKVLKRRFFEDDEITSLIYDIEDKGYYISEFSFFDNRDLGIVQVKMKQYNLMEKIKDNELLEKLNTLGYLIFNK